MSTNGPPPETKREELTSPPPPLPKVIKRGGPLVKSDKVKKRDRGYNEDDDIINFLLFGFFLK